jgi:hypothetical protein
MSPPSWDMQVVRVKHIMVFAVDIAYKLMKNWWLSERLQQE